MNEALKPLKMMETCGIFAVCGCELWARITAGSFPELVFLCCMFALFAYSSASVSCAFNGPHKWLYEQWMHRCTYHTRQKHLIWGALIFLYGLTDDSSPKNDAKWPRSLGRLQYRLQVPSLAENVSSTCFSSFFIYVNMHKDISPS